MNQSARCHIAEATTHIRCAIKYSAETEDTSLIKELTEVLDLFDGWISECKPAVLNGTKFKWKNEYSFVPALQVSNNDV
ncbi:MAG: hypothetical protein CL855_08325 [Cryomorphaceae bacterium]|nr:hypothetical protein [Cryomorphaceae bacterium]|tara:strand:+ start:2952 stop:3188 length:237 start_codon:yes stop_codon:yes gene_type:complete